MVGGLTNQDGFLCFVIKSEQSNDNLTVCLIDDNVSTKKTTFYHKPLALKVKIGNGLIQGSVTDYV